MRGGNGQFAARRLFERSHSDAASLHHKAALRQVKSWLRATAALPAIIFVPLAIELLGFFH
jgi:hypothetical protein